MKKQREIQLLGAYRGMSLEDQVSILAIVKDRAKANSANRPVLKLVSSDIYRPAAFGDIAGGR